MWVSHRQNQFGIWSWQRPHSRCLSLQVILISGSRRHRTKHNALDPAAAQYEHEGGCVYNVLADSPFLYQAVMLDAKRLFGKRVDRLAYQTYLLWKHPSLQPLCGQLILQLTPTCFVDALQLPAKDHHITCDTVEANKGSAFSTDEISLSLNSEATDGHTSDWAVSTTFHHPHHPGDSIMARSPSVHALGFLGSLD